MTMPCGTITLIHHLNILIPYSLRNMEKTQSQIEANATPHTMVFNSILADLLQLTSPRIKLESALRQLPNNSQPFPLPA